ncbi:uncharacterized protein [Dysidea avara]|uniref:uncharacterized protein isoform X2 n=1 Tax=Dysidea avara TaxID=196820 RepID=UPI0033225410
MKQYKMPKEAEVAYFGRQPSSHPSSHPTQSFSTQTDSSDPSAILHLFKLLPLDSQLQLLSSLFSSFVSSKFSVSVPDGYLEYSANAMANLRNNSRSNVLYNLAKGLGALRADGSDSRFPVKRMPMGLIEYLASFFSCDNLQSVSCPADYRLWQQTMYCHFGQKWVRLHSGPTWGVAHSVQGQESWQLSVHKRCTMEALVNVPGNSERTLRRDFAVTVIEEAAKSHPNSWWWLKADGCDLNKGLKESARLQWSGDVDLNDGNLKKQYEKYRTRLEVAAKVGLKGGKQGALKDLEVAKS